MVEGAINTDTCVTINASYLRAFSVHDRRNNTRVSTTPADSEVLVDPSTRTDALCDGGHDVDA